MRLDATLKPADGLNLDGPPEARACTRCGGAFPPEALMPFREDLFCANCKRDYFQHLAQGTQAIRDGTRHVFIKRAMAKAVDLNLTVLLFFAVFLSTDPLAEQIGGIWINAAAPGVALVFHIALGTLTTCRFGGTPGKLLFRLRVADREGRPAGYVRALLRTVAEFLSMACLGLGYFLSDREAERRTLHDRIARTRVLAEKGPWPWA